MEAHTFQYLLASWTGMTIQEQNHGVRCTNLLVVFLVTSILINIVLGSLLGTYGCETDDAEMLIDTRVDA